MSDDYLRPFQRRVLEALEAGHSVILQAPTGAGKTRAALTALIKKLAEESNYDFPIKAIYAVPTRTLTQQFFVEYQFIADQIDRTYQTELNLKFEGFGRAPIAQQSGVQPEDPQFEAALTFCTIDQLLATFLGIPYGVGTKHANINPAACLGSYLILDEFHLYPINERTKNTPSDHVEIFGARSTTLRMLELLRCQGTQLSPFTLMTATLSTMLIDKLADLLGATVVSVLPRDDDDPATKARKNAELDTLNANRQRIYTVADQPLTAQAIVQQHQHCSLAICNTVKRAQQIYSELLVHKAAETHVILLHSRFTDADRKAKHAAITEAMGKQAWNDGIATTQNLIIVTTQVVEVGVDISAEQLHTEISPANSLIQRAGRCARFPNQHGTVHIYPLLEPENPNSYLPYDQRDCLATLEQCREFDGQHVGFMHEQVLIDYVHTATDLLWLEGYQRNITHINTLIANGWGNADRSIKHDLIRDVRQVSFLIHDNPNEKVRDRDHDLHIRPWEFQTFSIRPDSLRGVWKKLSEMLAQLPAQGSDWDAPSEQNHVAWVAQLSEIKNTGDDENERTEQTYEWQPVTAFEQAQHALFIAFPRTVVHYSAEFGIVFRDGSFPELEQNWQSSFQSDTRLPSRRRFFEEHYEQETYFEHIQGLYKAYQDSRLLNEIQYAASRLETVMGLQHGAIDHAIRLAIACHDIGKLGTGWQAWCERWQNHLLALRPKDEHYQPTKRPFAHTDYYRKTDKEIQREFNKQLKRPHHACESAYLARILIEDSLGFYENEEPVIEQLARATHSAIARHHASFSKEYQGIQLINEAAEKISDVLHLVKSDQLWSFDIERLLTDTRTRTTGKLHGIITLIEQLDPDIINEAFCYFLIVRVLRLCDRRSFQVRQ